MGVRLVALVPILGLLLLGCSSSAQEPLPQPPAFSATPTPTPTAVAIEVPPSARATDAVGAAAFARFYLAALSRAFNTGDTAQIVGLSDPACGGCNNLIALTKADAAAGKRYEGGQFLVASAEATDDAVGAVVDVTYTRAPSLMRNSEGVILEQSPADPGGLLQARVIRTDDGWRMRGIRFPENPA